MSYFILFPAGLCFAACAVLSYSDGLRGAWWLRPSGAILGGLSTYLWFVGVDLTGSKAEEYKLGAAWTCLAEVAWFLVPLVMGVRFGWLAVFGLVLVACGVLLIHADSP